MNSFLQAYLEKCGDYSVKPKQRLIKEVNEAIKKNKLLPHVVLNGNCVSMFEDRMADIDMFPLCEMLEKDVQSTSLDLSYNEISDYGASPLARLIETNRFLRHICLKGNSIGPNGCKEIAEALAKNDKLISFDISENNIGSEGGRYIALALTGSRPTMDNDVRLSTSKTNCTLKVLNINNTGLETLSITYLALIMKDHPSIKTLKIAKPHLHSIEDTCIHLAEMLKFNKTLTYIDLSYHNIKTEGIEILTRGLMFNSTLSHLKLTGNEISIDGAKALSLYIRNSKCALKHLDLAANKIRDRGCIEIARSFKENKMLQSLDVSFNSILDEGLTVLGNVILNMIKETSIPRIRRVLLLGNSFGQSSTQVFDQIQKKNEEFSQIHKNKENKSSTDLVELDIVTYQVDGTFFFAEKKNCCIPTPTVDTKPEQIEEVEKLLNMD